MLKSAFFVLTTSYIAWYFENHELNAIYPFDATYVTPATAGWTPGTHSPSQTTTIPSTWASGRCACSTRTA